jgi:hypothetical protein
MSHSDVAGGEMNFNRISDADIEALIAGEPVAGAPGQLTELVGALRSEFDATPAVGVGTALGEFIDVIDLTTTPTVTSAGRARGLGTKAAAVFGAVSVKILLGAAVAAASVGGAHVLGVVDVPGLPNITDTMPVEIPEPVRDTPVQPPVPIETDDGSSAGQGEQDRLPGSEGSVPEPIVPATDGPEPGDGCELGLETAGTNAGGATEALDGVEVLPADPCTIYQVPDESDSGEPGRPEDVPAGPPESVPAGLPENVSPGRTPPGG